MGIENDPDGLKDDAAVKTEKTGKGPTYLFLSYARDDDEPFVRRLYEDLKRQRDNGRPLFDVWFDRESMPSRQLTFHHEIRSAINACDRLILVVGPHAVTSDYVTQEWQFAHLVANKCVNPIVRLDGKEPDGTITDGYGLIPEELKVHAEDFRDDRSYAAHLIKLIRQLSEPLPPVGKLVAVPELPPGFRTQPERLKVLRDLILADLQKPVVISGARARVGMQGMGGIGKSVLANAMARHPVVRRAFKDGIYWVALGQQPNILDLQHWLARELGGDAAFENEFTGRERLRELLLNRETLLILDNVWERGHAEAFNVVGSLGRILLTTRDTGLVTALAARENHYRVELPSRAEAEALLASAAEIDPPDLRSSAAALEIVNQCGRLPLALALCGGMVVSGTTWEDVLEALRNHDLAFLSVDHPAEEQHRNIWTAMNASLHVLPHDQQSRFAELAVFALDTGGVDTAVATLWEHTGGLSPRESRKLLADFARRSLVGLTDIEGEAPRKRVVLHDLLHSFASAMAQKRLGSEAALHDLLLDAYKEKCTEGWPTSPDDGYFLQNLCRHLLTLGYWNQLIGDENQPGILTDLLWIDKRVRAGQVFGLLGDYNAALAALPEFREETELERQTIARCRRYGEELIRHARNPDVFPLPAPPPTVGRNTEEKIPEERSERARRLRHFSNFVSEKALPLSVSPDQAMEMAANHAAEDPVAESGRKYLEHIKRPWLKCSPCVFATRPLRSLSLRTFEGHKAIVKCVCLTADGRRVVSGGFDNTLRVWDIESGQSLRTVTVTGYEENLIECMSITPDGQRALFGKWGTLDFWDLESGKCLQTLKEHNGRVSSVSITPDGRLAVSGSNHGTVCVWDIERGQCLSVIEEHKHFTKVLMISERRLNDPVWYMEITSTNITPNGFRVVSAGLDDTIRVWDISSGQCIYMIEGHEDNITSINTTPDGRRAVSGSWDKTLRVWDLESEKCLHTLKGHEYCITSVCLTPDGRRAVSGSLDQTLRVWDIENGRCLRILEGHCGSITSVSLSPDGRLAVSGSEDGTLRVWDLRNRQGLHTPKGHKDLVASLSLSSNGKRVVSGSWDKTLRVWDLENGQCLHTLKGHENYVTSVSITTDGRRVVSGSWDKTLRVWDLECGKCLRILKGHKDHVIIVNITPDGQRVVSGSWDHDRDLRVWDLESGQCLLGFEVAGYDGSGGFINVTITTDGRRAITIDPPFDCTLKLWNLENGKHLRTLSGHKDHVRSVSITPDGRRVVSGSRDKTLRVWDLENGQCLHTLKGHKDCVTSVSITPDGRRVVSGSWDNTLRVWDLENWQYLRTLTGHEDPVTSVSITPDGRMAVSISLDKTLRVWDLDRGQCYATYNNSFEIISVALSEAKIVCGDKGGKVIFLSPCYFPPIEPIIATIRRIYKFLYFGSYFHQARCPLCTAAFDPPPIIADTINYYIGRSSRPLKKQSVGGYHLPDYAFEDPRLLFDCPGCGKLLRFNPFFVDIYP